MKIPAKQLKAKIEKELEGVVQFHSKAPLNIDFVMNDLADTFLHRNMVGDSLEQVWELEKQSYKDYGVSSYDYLHTMSKSDSRTLGRIEATYNALKINNKFDNVKPFNARLLHQSFRIIEPFEVIANFLVKEPNTEEVFPVTVCTTTVGMKRIRFCIINNHRQFAF